MYYITQSTQETMRLGEQLASCLRAGDVLLLDGDLGAGKTHFVKGLARGLGYGGDVSSPTFTILNSYPLPGPIPGQLNHFDVYRVHEEDEILDLGFEEIIYSTDISVIEWSDLIGSILPDDFLKINLSLGESPDERKIAMNWSTSQSERSLPHVDTCR
ncbi:tRNA (adenosine(37)-N6)-threonylcarbamoyltransferase complex ATPase subunit type 1 TsaE [Clostridiaceae bacterium HFYG-1003]|nr:tRNA (adenosine(37)-N6)-threonylcarbamoyltransferase complex ATPase subunit type 1 TsaE [Clostridiaceae bacterium HFYG-1003]